jgi:hypothetical protein
MSSFTFLDAYTLRARLFPAVLAAAPALAALTLLISWEKIALSNVIATGALLVLLFVLADFARKQGLLIEPDIYKEMGGKPSVVMFRRTDDTIDQHAKDQYRQFLAAKLGRAAPTANEETADQRAADSFYEQGGIWLRHNTRDAKKFPILFGELISYGFRRNLWGLKLSAFGVSLIVMGMCFFVLWQRYPFDASDVLIMRTGIVLAIAVIQASYFALAVTKEGVKEAARRYGRELILSSQSLMPSAPIQRKSKKKPAA